MSEYNRKIRYNKMYFKISKINPKPLQITQIDRTFSPVYTRVFRLLNQPAAWKIRFGGGWFRNTAPLKTKVGFLTRVCPCGFTCSFVTAVRPRERPPPDKSQRINVGKQHFVEINIPIQYRRETVFRPSFLHFPLRIISLSLFLQCVSRSFFRIIERFVYSDSYYYYY